MYDESANLSVDELAARKLISVRAMNLCKREQLFSFTAIDAYYRLHGSFKNLPCMGNKTNEMLVRLCGGAAKNQLHINHSAPVAAHDTASAQCQPFAVIKAYQLVSEAGRSAAEQVYGNLVCTLNRRVMRALFIVYKTKTLAGLINGLKIKPSAFDRLAKALLPKGVDLYNFLNTLTQSVSGHELTHATNEYKWQTVVQQLAQFTRKGDIRMETFIKENIHELATGNFPVSQFINVWLHCNNTLKPTYKQAVLVSDLFYQKGFPPSVELQQQLGIGRMKLQRLYQDNGQHNPVYNHVSQAIKILLKNGLVPPAGFVFSPAPYHFFTSDTPVVKTPFTSRLLFPVIACFNAGYRMFYRAAGANVCVLFVNKSIESWFNTASFFAALEKKVFTKIWPDDTQFLLPLLLPYCRRTLCFAEQQQLFAFTKPLLLQLHEQELQSRKKKQSLNRSETGKQQLVCRFIKDKTDIAI